MTYGREVANYFSDYNVDSIKKRYQFCRRIIMATFTIEDVAPQMFWSNIALG